MLRHQGEPALFAHPEFWDHSLGLTMTREQAGLLLAQLQKWFEQESAVN